MAPYYEFLLADANVAQYVPRREEILRALREKNSQEIARLDSEQKRAEENEGDIELHTVLKQRAMYLARIGDKEAALPAIDEAFAKATGTGSKIDFMLLKIRLGLFYGDPELTEKSMASAAALIEEGGDWDRRNRLTAYRGVYAAPAAAPQGSGSARPNRPPWSTSKGPRVVAAIQSHGRMLTNFWWYFFRLPRVAIVDNDQPCDHVGNTRSGSLCRGSRPCDRIWKLRKWQGYAHANPASCSLAS